MPAELTLAPESAYDLSGEVALLHAAQALSPDEFSDEIIRREGDKPRTRIFYDKRPLPLPLEGLFQRAEAEGKTIPGEVQTQRLTVDFYRLDLGFDVVLPPEGGEQVERLFLRVDLDPQRRLGDHRVAVHQVFPPTEYADRLSKETLEHLDAVITTGLKFIPVLAGITIPTKAILLLFNWKVARMISSGSNNPMAHWDVRYKNISGDIPLTLLLRVPKGTKELDLSYSGKAKIDVARFPKGRWYDLRAYSLAVQLT